MKLAISSYSFNRFGAGPEGTTKPSFSSMMETCASLGIDGIEFLGVHFESIDQAELHQLKREALLHAVDIIAVSAHHNFVVADPGERRKQIDTLCRWVDVAAELGAPTVRAFGGRWGTIRSFDDLMAAKGEEPPQPGYSVDEGYAWSVEAFQIASYYADRRGVTLALENHWGLTGTADGVRRILQGTNSPALMVALDTGNFNYRPDQYAELADLAPLACIVHAKTYFGGGQYYDGNLDYVRIKQILDNAGYRGYVSIEFEGKLHPDVGIPASVELLRETMGM